MTIRISGFSTGLDIDQIVKDLMAARRQPLNKLNQQRTLIEWKREQYREISSKIVDLRNNKLFNYSLSSSLKAMKASVTGGTASAITAKATSAAQTGTITIKVGSLATVAYARTDKEKPISGDSATKLTALGFTAIDGKIAVSVNSKTIEVDEDATVGDLVKAINASDAGVNAYFDDVKKRLSLTAKETGTGEIALSANMIDAFNLTDKSAGSKATVTINGIDTERESNTFTVNGVEITLNSSSSGETLVINVGTDTDKIMETVKSFINDYNNILDTVNKKLNEQRFRNYPPLTSEQKEELTEREIELWESKAKSGLLRNDTILTTMINEFRLAIVTDVKINNQNVNLAEYGIGTGDWTQRGKLVIIDEDKLREKIEEDPDKFLALFTQTSETNNKSATASDSGLFRRLSNIMERNLNQLAEKAGVSRYSTDPEAAFSESSSMGAELRTLNNRIKDLNARLHIIENNYYKQFAAMEAAINRFNAQALALFSS